MGVWGLMSFMQMAARPVAKQLSFSEEVNGVRSAIMVDGHAFSHDIFQRCDNCVWWDGGDLRLVSKQVTQWVKAMRSCGLEPHFIFDGMMVRTFLPSLPPHLAMYHTGHLTPFLPLLPVLPGPLQARDHDSASAAECAKCR